MDMNSYKRAKYREDKDWKEIPDPTSSYKYDGGHYALFINDKGEPHLISRRPSVKGEWLDRSAKLPHVTNIPVPQLAGNIYSTEIIWTGHKKNNIESHAASSGILNSLPPKAIETQRLTGPLRVVLHDVINPPLKTFAEKIQHLKEVEQAFGKPDIIYSPEFKIGHKAVQEQIEGTKKSGREGVIITSLSAPEISNIRIKVKHTNTYNLRVVKILQEYDIHGTPKESMGALVVIDGTGREVANVGTGFTREQRKQIWLNPRSVIGELIQVKAQDTTARKLRSPVYNGLADGDIDTI